MGRGVVNMISFYTLGTSSAVPTTNRDLACHFLNFQGEKIVFDCGEGAQKSLMRHQLGILGIDRIFISHWHADHFSGLLGLVQTLGMEGRERPLYIYGPPRTEEFTQRLLELGYFNRRYDIYVEELEPGEYVDGEDYRIKAIETDHDVPSLGYVFEEDAKAKASRTKMDELELEPSPKIGQLKDGKTVEIDGREIKSEDIIETVPGRKIVYTGDTDHSQKVIDAADGADLLVHDATFLHELKEQGRDSHASAKEAAMVAKEADVDQLILTHFSRRYDMGTDELVEEAQEIFEPVVAAADGNEYTVKAKRPGSEQ